MFLITGEVRFSYILLALPTLSIESIRNMSYLLLRYFISLMPWVLLRVRLVMVPFLQISDLTGYFIYIGIASLALASACVIERLHSPKQPEQEMPFVSVPQSSIEVTQLDPRSDEK